MKRNVFFFLFAGAVFAQDLRVGGAGASVTLDAAGNVRQFSLRERPLRPPSPYSFFELDGALAESAHVQATPGVTYRVAAGKASGMMNISFDRDIRYRFEAAPESAVKKVGMVLTFPLDTVFHLAEYRSVGRRLDRDMPVGESYEANLNHNFFAAETNGMCIRVRSDEPLWLNRAWLHLIRQADWFTATFTWEAQSSARLAVFPSLDEAIVDHQRYLEEERGVRKLSQKPGSPAWLRDIKVVVTADMMRSNNEITHDYKDLLNLAREMKDIRDPRQTLIYIPGWQGAYDVSLPGYRPHPALGGAAGFRETMDALHKWGYRVMIHSTIWGIDPYLPEVEDLEPLAVRKGGELFGWMMTPEWSPAKLSLKFRTPRIPLRAAPDARSLMVETDDIPADCEAFLSAGGLKGAKGRIRLTSNGLSITTPPNWFDTHDSFDFPYPLFFHAGRNKIEVTVTGGDASQAWYSIRSALRPDTPHRSWTYPILMADSARPEYQKAFVEHISAVVKEYSIDALHMDAGSFYNPVRSRELYYQLRDALPGVVMATEYFATYEELGYWQLSQGARQHMKNYTTTLRCGCEQGSVAPQQGMDELYAWLNKPSPVCRFVKDYVVVYPHLCAANAFVPVGKVCNREPPRQMPPHKEELWDVLRQAKALDYVPGLRVNYRKYGLDADTRQYLKELR